MFSNLIWLGSSTPQYIQNCKTKRVDGQSPFFFSLLFSGNVFSLIGLLINGGLVVQLIQAIIYVILDGILFSQYIYYRCCYVECCKDQLKADNDNKKRNLTEIDDASDDIIAPAVAGVAAAVVLAAVDYAHPYKKADLVGTLFGWASACIYISSRIPQVIKNFTDKIVKDLSPFYVILAIAGNGTYLMSLFIKSVEAQFCWNQMPWIIGAGGPLCCDCIFLIQMCVFGLAKGSDNVHEDKSGEEQEEDNGEYYDEIKRISEL
ncbi:basic amino acid transmembrane export protein, SEVEN transmembrane protein 1-related family [Trichomonas vaginalis G3]|uniref:basic amino acid transmembrane export protein, SEVEN transmembrane protein 1-related family n=1 Tax=Trichomonas vaginalis (strain ATCC PRA-98 / G3) TaxID=412133 RepID=UPI0021E6043E|nr:basic amino acid transmembrane export protein, SEVEN transmembrane protein 1-related family [Trichomonas vaginalis G3]KAI5506010.1 basic amino acid transmembrane export protein, SEVEN transmembrane protein 1-related family [Trichomonas vaginalis G3]